MSGENLAGRQLIGAPSNLTDEQVIASFPPDIRRQWDALTPEQKKLQMAAMRQTEGASASYIGPMPGGDGADVGREFGEVTPSTSKGVQDWLQMQIDASYKKYGVWPDLPGGFGRASRALSGRTPGRDDVLPIILSVADAKEIYHQLGLKEEAIIYDSDHNLRHSEYTATANLIANLFVKMDEYLGARGTLKIPFVQYTGAPPLPPSITTPAAAAPAPSPGASGWLGPSLGPSHWSTASPSAPPPSQVFTLLSPQATYDFLYYASKLAIALDAVDGMPSDNEMFWWAVIQTARDVVDKIKTTGSVGLIVAGVLFVGFIAYEVARDRY